jgi:hypothetical protein
MIADDVQIKVISYLTKNPKQKTQTWEDIAVILNLPSRQVRYIWETYLKTPSSDNYDNEPDSVPADLYEPVPAGYIKVPKGYYANGKISYDLVKVHRDIKSVIQEAMADFIVKVPKNAEIRSENAYMLWSDVHIGMSTKGTIFDQKWMENVLLERCAEFVQSAPTNKNIYLAMLGDYIDGEDGYTASRSHRLPQNMTDQEMFKIGLTYARYVIEGILKKSKGKVTVLWVWNCNHNKTADHNIGYALEALFSDNPLVDIVLLGEFINHYATPDAHLILTHGKDNALRRRGLPLPLNAETIGFIRNEINSKNLIGKPVLLLRGDLHQSSHRSYPDFIDIMCPSFAPPSGWCALNFLSSDPGGYGCITFNNNTPYVGLPRFK